MAHNEDSRVKIPALLHLTRLGYEYLSIKKMSDDDIDRKNNIFTKIFKESLFRINDKLDEGQFKDLYRDITLELDYEDLGQAFYKRLVDRSGIRLVDFENFNNNSFHVVTELPYKSGDETFRPDVILLINGMPLVFIEVKKPNNKDGILAERNRMDKRFQNKYLKKFANITQFMIFSNNMEYDKNAIAPVLGAFYASPSYGKHSFNYFREEEKFDLSKILKPLDDAEENKILKDNNLISLKHQSELATNKQPTTPTNRILTSLCSRDRLAFVLRYALAYVNEESGLQKHIMRYPQMFATKAIATKLDDGIRKGIIWHTQGSGKTSLAFFNVKHLTDYYQKKGIIPKFYFIVDRLDLLIQAKKEFLKRGLRVNIVNSRDDFKKDIKKNAALHGNTGQLEITVVNIHKFSEDSKVTTKGDYDISTQRIYFLDEVHRSYNPKGSFLANLNESDPNSIKIGLTGTPLIDYDELKSKKQQQILPSKNKKEKNVTSKDLFGDYIHKYYYNLSIADGYTLRLIREEIATEYKLSLAETLKEIEILKGDAQKKEIFAHKRYVEPLLDYIVNDFQNFRIANNDYSTGGMVICDSSEQAKEMYRIFMEKYGEKPKEKSPEDDSTLNVAAETPVLKLKSPKVKTAAIILHDIGTKEDREGWVRDYKHGKIDFLFVFNMLLTGFDAKRLKKLYIGRLIKRHNLLQALTRVNRTYKNYRYGYVVDFADISKEFDATNQAYFDELQQELGDNMENYSNIFKSKKEVEEEIEEIKDVIWEYDLDNLEEFRKQIGKIQDKKEALKIRKALEDAKGLYNLIRLFGHYDLLDKLDFKKIPKLYSEAAAHIDTLNKIDAVQNQSEVTNLLNIALEDIIFKFKKVAESELLLVDQLKDKLRKTRLSLGGNFDHKDPQFISLEAELERLFDSKKIHRITQEDIKMNIDVLEKIYEKIGQLNSANDRIRSKYNDDEKFARIHKRLVEQKLVEKERKLFEALSDVKEAADEKILKNSQVLENEDFFNQEIMQMIYKSFNSEHNIPLEFSNYEMISNLLTKEYINEYNNIINDYH